MKNLLAYTIAVLAPIVAFGCGAAEEPSSLENTENTAHAQQGLTFQNLKDAWGTAGDVLGAVSSLYSALQWLKCNVDAVRDCPESEAQQAADTVIARVGAVVESDTRFQLIGSLHALLSRSARDFADLAALGQMGSLGEEAGLVDDTEALFNLYVDKLTGSTDPTNQQQVETAYTLAPAFLILAAYLDQLARIELVRHQAPMTLDALNNYRVQTLTTIDALVGQQSLWYSCVDGTTNPMNTVATWDRSFTTKKLWKLFADKSFTLHTASCDNDCDVFRAATGATICKPKCTLLCACAAVFDDYAFRLYAPTVFDEMERDSVVRALRASSEKLVAMKAEHGSALLFRRPTGQMELWNMLSSTSYKPIQLATPGSNWKPIGSGDLDGDGDGDIFWSTGSSLSEWLLQDRKVATMTLGTDNAPSAPLGFVDDQDGDGVADIWWSLGPGGVGNYQASWLMDKGSTIPRSTVTWFSGSDSLQGVGDFARTSATDPAQPRRVMKLMRTAYGDLFVDDAGTHHTLGSAGFEWQVKGVGDFDGDRVNDVLWYNVNDGRVGVWTISGFRVTGMVLLGSSDPAAGWTIQAVADVDHDGISDVIWRHGPTGDMNIWMVASPTSVRDFSLSFEVPTTTAFVGTVDLGPPAPVNPANSTIAASYCGFPSGQLQNMGFGNYEQAWDGSFFGSYGTFLGDVDFDGKDDLVGVGDGYIGVIASHGGRFGGYETWFHASSFRGGSHGTLFGDVNGDTTSDLVFLRDQAVYVSLSVPGGGRTFALQAAWGAPILTGTSFVADVDGDRKADLVTKQGNDLNVMLSNGNGFGLSTNWLWNGNFNNQQTLVGDASGDGKADVVNIGPSWVSVLRSNGTSFQTPETWLNVGFSGSNSTLLKDVNGDKLADLIAVDNDRVRVRRSTGTGFGDEEVWWGRVFIGSHGTLIGDVDGNSRGDLVGLGDGYVGLIRAQ